MKLINKNYRWSKKKKRNLSILPKEIPLLENRVFNGDPTISEFPSFPRIKNLGIEIPYSKKSKKIPLSKMDTFPYSSIGKLVSIYYRTSTDEAGEKGSAFIIGENLIMTAGHCVFGDLKAPNGNDIGKGLFYDFYFYPSFPLNANPIRIKKAYVAEKYMKNSLDKDRRIPFDVGFLVTEESFAPEQIIDLEFEISSMEEVNCLGYPDKLPYLGAHLYNCIGNVNPSDENGYISLYMKDNDLVSGSSGGPWVKDGRVIGLTSHSKHTILTYSDRIEEERGMFSPYFSTEIKQLIEEIKRENNIM